MRQAALLLLAFALPVCATLVTSSSQTVAVPTKWPAATGIADQVGSRLGAIPQTPHRLQPGNS